MPSIHTRPRAFTLLITAIALFSAACSTENADETIAVTGTNDSCELAATELAAGNIGFEFSNRADDVNELYVLRENGDVVSEVENVTTGTKRTLIVDLVAGDYSVVCKPGQTGDGFAANFTVTGEGGTELAEADRTLTFTSGDFTYNDLDLGEIVAGNTVRFEMTNLGAQEHEFEVLDESGEALGEVAAIGTGLTGGATITFTEPGTYVFQCILIDPETEKPHTELGMTGTFEVPAS